MQLDAVVYSHMAPSDFYGAVLSSGVPITSIQINFRYIFSL